MLIWFDTTPQTNEAGRSGSVLLGLAWAHANASADSLDFEVLEIGSSGGLNLLMPHYHYTFTAENGSDDSWDWGEDFESAHSTRDTGPCLLAGTFFVSARGAICIQSICPTMMGTASEGFVWADMEWRLRNLERQLEYVQAPPSVVREDAAAW